MVDKRDSKSVLRVAAEQVAKAFEGVAYFPSYEIITGNFNRGQYYGPDLRDVTEAGVVTLTGTTDDNDKRTRIGEIARNTPGVKRVVNNITVGE